jgi:hypothetical protein
MDNQHRKIAGYRELDEIEIAQMNEVKNTGERLCFLVQSLRQYKGLDTRWIDIGETHLQQGIMALVRAIARPTTF